MVRLMSTQEKFYYTGRPSWLNQMGSFASMAILILMPFFARGMTPVLSAFNVVAALLIMLAIVYNRYIWEFSVSDSNVQSRRGITTKKQKSLRLKSIRKIEVKQTAIQRMFGVGDIVFSAAGSSSERVIFCGVESPSDFREKVLRIQCRKSG